MTLLPQSKRFQSFSPRIIFTGRNSNCGKVMFSQARAIPSVHRMGGGGDPRKQLGRGQTPLPTETTTEVGSTHPTGMHCLLLFFIANNFFLLYQE